MFCVVCLHLSIMAESVLSVDSDISKLKVPDLRKELKNRGLHTTGNKNELIDRLQIALKSENGKIESVDDLDEDLLNEEDDDVHLETTESVISDLDTALNDTISPKERKRKLHDDEANADQAKVTAKRVVLNRNTPVLTDIRKSTESDVSNGSDDKKVVKLSAVTAQERLEMRAKKFNVNTLSVDAKKAARAARFGGSETVKTPVISKTDSNAALQQRAARFGLPISKPTDSVEQNERLEKRKARFGIVTVEDKVKQRQERFKTIIK